MRSARAILFIIGLAPLTAGAQSDAKAPTLVLPSSLSLSLESEEPDWCAYSPLDDSGPKEGACQADAECAADSKDVAKERARACEAMLNAESPGKDDLEACLKYFKTSANKFCEKTYCCRHFSRDFCKEYSEVVGLMCVGFAFGCKEDGKFKGHQIAFAQVRRNFWCLVEPQSNDVIHCLDTKASPPPKHLSIGTETYQALIANYSWYGECLRRDLSKDSTPFCVDPSIMDDGRGLCCECYRPADYTTFVTGPSGPYCTGTCAEKSARFEKRVECPEPIPDIPPVKKRCSAQSDTACRAQGIVGESCVLDSKTTATCHSNGQNGSDGFPSCVCE